MKKEYTLGLDIGTNSVGWAVVDENRQLVRKGKKRLWGVRMFDESSDASERRTYRNSRRRIQRRKERITLLRDLFSSEINKVDTTFFQRMDESFYTLEDRNIKCNDLFNNFMTNKEYYDTYPTIWHLRKELCTSKEKADIRLIYLACHHIVKYRGNFLQEGEVFVKGDVKYLVDIMNQINDSITETREFFESEDGNDGNDFSSYLANVEFNDELMLNMLAILNPNNKEIILNNEKINNKGVNAKINNLKMLLNVTNKDIYGDMIIDLLVKNEKNISTTKIVKSLKEEKKVLNLYSENLENEVEDLISTFDDLANIIEILPQLKYITDYVKLEILLGDNNLLSSAFVSQYDRHKCELNSLKYLLKKYDNDQNYYNKMFRQIDSKIIGLKGDKEANYAQYVGLNSVNSTKQKNFKHAPYEAFLTYVKRILSEIQVLVIDESDLNLIKDLLTKAEEHSLLLRINGSSNGSIPKQLHLQELKLILNNQKEYYPFLSDLDVRYNITTYDKILEIFKFKRDYFVGPLKGEEFSWVIKNNDEKVYPWNFEQVVNMDETAQKFITRMLNKCTYLKGEKDYCLPKDSLTYSEYNVLNYLNTLKIDNQRISLELRNELYNEVFLKNNKVTSKKIREYIFTHYNKKLGDTDIPEVTCSLSSHIKFKEIFGDEFENSKELIENIISDITIFEDKKILVRRLESIYNLSADKIKQIKSLNYKKTARLCKNLLNDLLISQIDLETGEVIKEYHGILSIMRGNMSNLQEILFSPLFNTTAAIDDYNKKVMESKEEDNSLLSFLDENVTISPVWIRPFIQSIRIIDELEDILGQKIDYFVVECTRTNKAEKKKQSKSRYDDLKEKIVEASKKFGNELLAYHINTKDLLNRIDDETIVNGVKNSDAIYFYFSQLGKDMYTGEDIDLDDLLSSNSKYDIDHIYPQSLVKDDSISNRVLTSKALNNKKQNNFLCEAGVLSPGIYKFHKLLLESNLISKTKYNRLTEKEVDENILGNFAARQKVATDQAVKALITTLKLYKNVEETHIIYSKAENISDFRKEYNIYKSRTANNYHHAHDAYLNAVLGKMFDDYFRSRQYLKNYRIRQENDEAKQETTNFMKIVKYPRTRSKTDVTPIWRGKEDIDIIEYNIKNTFDIQETTRTYIGNNMYSKTTILPKENGTVKVKNFTPNGNEYDIEKYGGITSSSYSKYAIIKYKEKNKDVTQLIAVPRIYLDEDGTNTKLMQYIESELHKKDYTIEHNCIKTNVIIREEKTEYIITGKTGESYVLKNAKDRNFDYKSIEIIHNIDKYLNMISEKNNKYVVEQDKIILHATKKHNGKFYNHNIEITRENLDYLYQQIIDLYSKDIYVNLTQTKAIIDLMKTSNFKLEINDYVLLISNILDFLKTNERKEIDLRLIGGAKQAGQLKINSKLRTGMKFIQYSNTGLREKVLYEVK